MYYIILNFNVIVYHKNQENTREGISGDPERYLLQLINIVYRKEVVSLSWIY